MKLRAIPAAIVVLGAALALTTCTAGGSSIFYTIENEQKVGSGTLPQYLVIADIAMIGSGGPYYVAAGTVFQGTMSGTPASMNWTPNYDNTARPYNPTYNGAVMLCNALTYWPTKGNLYGGFYTADAEHYGLYSASSLAVNWSQIALPSGSGEQVTYLQVAGSSYLYIGGAVVSSNNNMYELDYYDGTTSVVKSTLGGNTLTTTVKGVVYSASYGYFVATNDAVYMSSTPEFSGVTAVTPSIGSSPDKINGIYSDGTNVFVLTERSGIFEYNGSSFTQLVADPQPSSGNYVGFLSMAQIGSSVYLVGSDNDYGYYILNGSTLTRYSDTTVALYVESVSRILVDGSNVFMGTNATGLWGATMDASGNLLTTWTHEEKS